MARDNCKDSNNINSAYFSYVDNLKSIEYAIKDIFTLIKLKISKKEENSTHFSSSIKLLVLQLGVWSEARLNKLLYEYSTQTQQNLLTDLEYNLINLNKQKIEQWKTVIELSFRKHYRIYIGEELSSLNLGEDKFKAYQKLIEIVEHDLRVIIEFRNRLAHGQWVCRVKINENSISRSRVSIFDKLDNENIISLEKKYQILQYLAKIIHDLMVSKNTFERDFDKYYKEITDRKIFLDKHIQREYQKRILKLQKKR